ncbi:efflux RND transporter periplasmic adaptor subunit [Patescibacteria group bacterium]|nr:efflux RND transporter periplasmic adaptor subunit [Patescibacteria group bacterium]
MKNIFNSVLSQIKKRWKLSSIIAIVIILILVFVARSNATKNNDQLKFEHPVKDSITKMLEVSGHVDAKQKARLRFIAGGKVVYLGAQEGDIVKKWQTIATIDGASLAKTLQKDLNLYMKERWDWETTVDDIKDRPLETTEQRTVDKEQWDLNNTVIDVEIQDIAIKNTAIYAPFEGILTSSPTAVTGVQLLASDYFEIVNPESLIFRAAVDESDISFISEGQTANLVLDSYPNETIITTVSYVSFVSTETSSGTAFVIEFPLNKATDGNLLRIGMNGDIHIVLETKDDVLTIPTISITQRNDKTYVNVKTGENQAEEREIKIGLETDDIIEILEGLTESDEIVVPEQ